MAFRVGDHVHIIDEEGEGVILELKRNNMVMVEIDDFSYEFPITNLIKVDSDNNIVHKTHEKSFDKYVGNETPINKVNIAIPISTDVFDSMSRKGYPELDLHIHELVVNPQGMSNSEMLAIQIQCLEQFIVSCVRKSVSEFVVIHGVGEGVLRTEVHKVLDSHGNVSFHDADYSEYGYGATYAKMRGLFGGR